MSDAKVAFYRSIGLTGSLPDMERDFFEGSYRKVPYVLAQSAVPVCLAPNGTVATNGIVTLGTALPATYAGGIWLRLPANAVVGGSAGLYWAVMSSTTQGQVYSNFADPASEFIPFVPASPLVAAVGSNSAYTQSTGADVTLVNVTLPGSSLGITGALHGSCVLVNNNTAGNKILTGKIGSTSFYGPKTRTTSTGETFSGMLVRNRGVANRNMTFINTVPNDGGNSVAGNPAILDVNTEVDLSITITGQIATATDFIILEASTFEVLPS